MMMTMVQDVDSANFEAEVLNSPVPVFVDFYASWCAPCKAMMPSIEKAAVEHDGVVRVVKVDTDANQDIAKTYGVSSIPTFMVVKGGEVSERYSGVVTPSKLAAIFARCADGAK